MYHSYTIAADFFTNFFEEEDYELNAYKLKLLLLRIDKNSSFIDCHYDGIHEILKKDYQELKKSLSADDSLLKIINIIWIDMFNKRRKTLPSPKVCDCKDCSFDHTIRENKKYLKNFPDFVLSCRPVKHHDNIIINEAFDNSTYKKKFDKTSYDEELILDYEKGKEIILKNWSSLLGLCRVKIQILDRNVFSKWRDNYECGLKQFVEIISKFNPSIEIIILTKLTQPDEGRSKQDVVNQITASIKKMAPVKISFLLSDSEKFDHDRFILFDDLCAAQLGRGLDTFYAVERNGVPKIDRYRIIYYKVKEVEEYFLDPQRCVVKFGDFKPIRNF